MFLFGFLLSSLVVLMTGLVAYALVQTNLTTELEDGIDRLRNARVRETFGTTVITDRNGETLWELFGEGKRTAISLDQIPPELIEATISVEDDSFYDNKGFDETSIAAALIANYRNRDSGGRPIGGSTITQQIVRHIAFDYEERIETSYRRKVKELFLAWRMTQMFSKDEILEMYLNEIYYGNLAYGIEAASQTYFGKPARNLTLAEATFLSGLPQNPVGLDPYSNFDGAKARQWFILTLMVEDGVITDSAGETAVERIEATYLEPLRLVRPEASLNAPHFSVWVRQQLEEQFGAEELANGGWTITTSLDVRYQQLAEQVAREQIDALAGRNVSNASLVAIKPGTGEILAMVGSVDYSNEAIDGRVNIALSLQQPGSTIKPLTYAAAMQPHPETGQAAWSAADIVWDVPTTYQLTTSIYEPINYDEDFHGPMRLRTALANSYNVPAVHVLQDIGVDRLLDTARQMGISTFDPNAYYGLALTLGAGEVTPLEMTGAFATFANGGAHMPPVAILRVEKRNGEVLYEYEQPEPNFVIDPRVAFTISDMLSDNVARATEMGAASVLHTPFTAAAKTGTTNDFRDGWTMGYTPGLAAGVWVGNTDNTPMTGKTGGLSGAAPLWRNFMEAVNNDPALMRVLGSETAAPPTEFAIPTGIEERDVCKIGSMTADKFECERTTKEWVFDDIRLPFPLEEPSVANAMIIPAEGRWVDGEPPTEPQCVIDTEGSETPNGSFRKMMLMPPRHEEGRNEAYEWAQNMNLSIVPAVSCYGENGNAPTPLPTGPWPTATADPNSKNAQWNKASQAMQWMISRPTVGQTVTNNMSIVGTAQFGEGLFYQVEIRRPGREWEVLGVKRPQSVANAQLEWLNIESFNPGDYELRLVIVDEDGKFQGRPFTILFTIR